MALRLDHVGPLLGPMASIVAPGISLVAPSVAI